MFHAAGECDRHYVKKPDECGNNFFPIINVHRPLPMASIFNDSVDKASKILYSKRIYDVVYSFMGEMKTDIGIDTGVCVANMAVLILVFCFVYTKSGKMSQ